MGKKIIIEVRIVCDEFEIEGAYAKVDRWLKRDGFLPVKQPYYRKSRKDPANKIGNAEWEKHCE
ncbi:MAG: hypothetical protein WBA93_28990 [Microcoleaceae cyanobacterium]